MRFVTTQAILLRYGVMYLSLLELHLFLNVATVAEPGIISSEEQFVAGRMWLVTSAAFSCLEGSMDSLTA